MSTVSAHSSHAPAWRRARSLGALSTLSALVITGMAPAVASADVQAPGVTSVQRTTPVEVRPGSTVTFDFETVEAGDFAQAVLEFETPVQGAAIAVSDELDASDRTMELYLDPTKFPEGEYSAEALFVGDTTGNSTVYDVYGDQTTDPPGATPAPSVEIDWEQLSFTVDADGEYTAPTISPFIDVSTGQQFYKEMSWLAETGISTGWNTPAGREYRPLTPINRDAMAAFLYRMAGSPAYTAPAKSPFVDVSTDQQFYKEMAWLADQEISQGWKTSKGQEYRPLTPINRDAMAAFLYRLQGSPSYAAPTTSPFADVSTDQQFYTEMAWLADTGISTGWVADSGTTTYRPVSPINRDAMAAFLYRLDALNTQAG